MGNILKWAIPDLKDVPYNITKIYRASTKTGEYVEVRSQNISDNSYFDTAGSTNQWYKIRFYYTNSNVYSSYSNPIQGGKFFGYCTIDDIRTFSSKITDSSVIDSIIFDLIKFATAQVNQDILVEHRDELVSFISNEKQNKINGENTTFYTQNVYLADYNDDGIIDEEDIFVYTLTGSGTRTEYSVASIDDARIGKFTLDSAPSSGERMYLTYRDSPVLLYPTVNMNVRKATINYVLALSHLRLDPNQMRSFKVNKISVTGDSSPSKMYMASYTNLISKINSKSVRLKVSENVV